MTDYPTARPKVDEPQEQRPYRWIDDDCAVVGCNAGLISVEEDGYTTAYRCPDCQRWPNPEKPAMWYGTVTRHSSDEMYKRREERKEIYFESRRAKVPDVSKVGV